MEECTNFPQTADPFHVVPVDCQDAKLLHLPPYKDLDSAATFLGHLDGSPLVSLHVAKMDSCIRLP